MVRAMAMSRWKKAGAWFLGVILITGSAALGTTVGCASFGAAPSGARLERIQRSPQYVEGTFRNEDPTVLSPKGSLLSTTVEFLVGNNPMTVPNCELPLFSNTAAVLATPPPSGLRITWLGHSTTLIEIDGKRILTDPHWSDRASPFSFAGPKRFHPPPLAFDALPDLDAVIISHDHYDHLDMTTVQALAAKAIPIHVGLGVGAHLERWRIPQSQIIEHQWWEDTVLPGGFRIVSTPARHFSGRGLLNRNTTLWTSWSLIGPQHRVYFSGDTGLMSSGFQTIQEKLGPFDVAMLEIGQWHENWGQIHLGPQGALQAHRALGARALFPIHWATFELGLHSWSEPAETLITLAKATPTTVLTPLLGQPLEPSLEAGPAPWWRKLPPMASHCPAGTSKPTTLESQPQF